MVTVTFSVSGVVARGGGFVHDSGVAALLRIYT